MKRREIGHCQTEHTRCLRNIFVFQGIEKDGSYILIEFEVAFPTRREAQAAMRRHLVEGKNLCSFYRIVRIPWGRSSSRSRITEYLPDGRKTFISGMTRNEAPCPLSFRQGELVYIKPTSEVPTSIFTKGQFAVMWRFPPEFETLEVITHNERGFLSNYDVNVEWLSYATSPVPIEDLVLVVISRHLLQIEMLPDGVFNALYLQYAHGKNFSRYDFISRSILEAVDALPLNAAANKSRAE